MTIKYCNRAVEFWRGVAFDDGLRLGDPRKTLREWLINTGIYNSARTTIKKNQVALPMSVRVIASAWNKWIEGEEFKRVRIPDNVTLPLKIRETPYDSNWRYKDGGGR